MKNMTIAFALISLTLPSCKKADINVDITTDKWEVKNFKESGSTFAQKAKGHYILDFTSDTTYILTLDVNTCFGQYKIPQNGKIIFNSLGCTEVCCDTDNAEDISLLLPTMTDYSVKDDMLILTGNGQIKLERH